MLPDGVVNIVGSASLSVVVLDYSAVNRGVLVTILRSRLMLSGDYLFSAFGVFSGRMEYFLCSKYSRVGGRNKVGLVSSGLRPCSFVVQTAKGVSSLGVRFSEVDRGLCSNSRWPLGISFRRSFISARGVWLSSSFSKVIGLISGLLMGSISWFVSVVLPSLIVTERLETSASVVFLLALGRVSGSLFRNGGPCLPLRTGAGT